MESIAVIIIIVVGSIVISHEYKMEERKKLDAKEKFEKELDKIYEEIRRIEREEDID